MTKVRISGALSIMAGEVPKEETCRQEYCALLKAGCAYAAAIDDVANNSGAPDAQKLELAMILATREAQYKAALRDYYKARKDAFFAEVRKAPAALRLAVYAKMRSEERIRKVRVAITKDGYSDCDIGYGLVEFPIGRDEFAIFVSRTTGIQAAFNTLRDAMAEGMQASYRASASDEVTGSGDRISKRAQLRALTEIIKTATNGEHCATSADLRYLRDTYADRVGACKLRERSEEKFLTTIADVILHKIKGKPYELKRAAKQ